MLDKQMRYAKESVLNPLARWVGNHISPTEITLLGGLVGITAAGFAWQGWYLAGLVLWIANRILDGLDGTVARLNNKQTDLGGYIDIIVDNIVYAVVPIGLALSVDTSITYLALIFMLGIFYVNSASWMFLSSIMEKRAQGANKSGEMTSVTMVDGLIEGTETIIFYSLFFLLPQFMGLLFIIMGSLVIVTIVQRLHWAYHNLD
ncbi:MAG: CDP-alcohol phosphatidyltransferase family protein [Phototrophicaceae bacterium]